MLFKFRNRQPVNYAGKRWRIYDCWHRGYKDNWYILIRVEADGGEVLKAWVEESELTV